MPELTGSHVCTHTYTQNSAHPGGSWFHCVPRVTLIVASGVPVFHFLPWDRWQQGVWYTLLPEGGYPTLCVSTPRVGHADPPAAVWEEWGQVRLIRSQCRADPPLANKSQTQ
jgi:hypothetical protein